MGRHSMTVLNFLKAQQNLINQVSDEEGIGNTYRELHTCKGSWTKFKSRVDKSGILVDPNRNRP